MRDIRHNYTIPSDECLILCMYSPKFNVLNSKTIQRLSYIYYSVFVCLFVVLRVPLENFPLIWRRHQTGEGLQLFTYTRHL